MYKFDDCFYLYLNKVKNHLIYAHYSQEPGYEDKFYCEKMIYIKEIKSINISLGELNNQISVKVTFVNEQNKLESHDLIGSWKSFYFNNFTQVAKYINLLTSFVYSRPMFESEFNSNSDIEFTKHLTKLDDYEIALLNLTFDASYAGLQSQGDKHITVSELFDDNSLKYYYDVKIFKYTNKTTLVSFEAQEGYETKCSIVFFTTPFFSMENVDLNDRALYSVGLIDGEDREKYVISRLSKENYTKLKTWFELKIN